MPVNIYRGTVYADLVPGTERHLLKSRCLVESSDLQ